MNFFDALILGLLQGLTEFLPVSSSGHLVLGQKVLGVLQADNITFEIFVHFGTLFSILVIFWKDIWQIFLSLLGGIKQPGKIPSFLKENEHFRLAVLIVVGSIPAAVVGLMFKPHVERAFSDVNLVGVMLIVTGLVLFLTRLARPKPDKKVSWGTAILIGLAQAFAILPGISRAGMTISAGLFAGVAREQAARYSFLLALPAIFGATLLETFEISGAPIEKDFILVLIVGTVAAFIAGYVAIKTVFIVLKRDKFSYFSFYCLTVGLIVILLSS
jgi:undecaprenyl-diphosphatase